MVAASIARTPWKARGVTADHVKAIVDGIAVNLALDLSFDAPPSTIQP
jgi:hypothetical protein